MARGIGHKKECYTISCFTSTNYKNKTGDILETPEIAHLEEESPFGFVKIIALAVIKSVPFEFLECRPIPGINDGSRNVGERNQSVQCQPVLKTVVFHDGPEEEIFVDLECIPAADDGVVVYLLLIRVTEEVHVRNVENKTQFFYGLILNVSPKPVSITLVGILGIVIDRPCVPVKNTPENMFCYLGCCLEANSTSSESFSCKDFICQ